jgi:ribosomal protein L11 methyltransferase
VTRKKSSSYTAVAFETLASAADEAAGIMIAFGAMGCEVVRSGAKTRERKGKAVCVRGYFERLAPATLARLATMLRGMAANGAAPAVRRVEDPGWATMWQSRFDPFPIGERFLIVPPWNRAHDPRRLQIVIQPGQAFGTGHHGSTFGTMCALERVARRVPVSRALDVGAGSGILAIAMRKLGIRDVTAIDIDPAALANAEQNAELNGLKGAIRFSVAPLSSIRGRFDLITANILSSVLIEMAPLLIARMRPGAHLILAGILTRETEAVARAYRPALKRVGTKREGVWAAMVFRR